SIGLDPDWLRYYIAAKLNANVEDVDFNPEDFLARVNSDLVGKYVNIASRCANFLNQRFAGRMRTVSEPGALAVLDEFQRDIGAIAEAYEQRDFGQGLRLTMRLA